MIIDTTGRRLKDKRSEPLSAPVRTPFDRDQLALLPRSSAATGALSMLDRLQDAPPHVLVGCVAVLFSLVAHRSGTNPHDLYEMGRKMARPQLGHRHDNATMEALDDYLKSRVQGRLVE